MKQIDLNDIRLFLKIAELKGLAPVAKALDLQKSKVSRRLSSLEQQIGLRLVHRERHRFALTDAGVRLLEEYRPIFERFEEAQKKVVADRYEMNGDIVVSIPMNLANTHFSQIFTAFIKQHPSLNIVCELSTRSDRLIHKEFDLGFVVDTYRLPEANLIARSLYKIPSGLFASPDFISKHGPLAQVKGLRHVPCITGSHFRQFSFETANGVYTLQVTGPLAIDSTSAQIQAAINGLGVIRAPEFSVQEAVEAGSLVQIELDLKVRPYEVYMVYKERELLPMRVRGLINFIIDQIIG